MERCLQPRSLAICLVAACEEVGKLRKAATAANEIDVSALVELVELIDLRHRVQPSVAEHRIEDDRVAGLFVKHASTS